jgi:KUP system potassium uptake protein
MRPDPEPQGSLAMQRQRPERETALVLGALGVVYGDLGTNPLFAMRECFASHHPLALVEANVFGAVSLAIWALLMIVCVKYTLFVLRADNEGEGGALALLAKIPARVRNGVTSRPFAIVVVLLFGSALLVGDGVVTPAISVLSAVEGLKDVGVAQDRVVIYTLVILAVLFLIQRFGTQRVGTVFGPVMLLWFLAIGALGLSQIVREPRILLAVDPRYAIDLLRSGKPGSYFVLGAIILCVGGGEALYADLGHFGRRPIVRAWYGLVLPALALTYVGQGALLLRVPSAIENPFYSMSPDVLRIPLVILATAATVIASQAMISGAFSLARQAVNLGFLPRLTILHTSNEETGQIYVPIANLLLMVGCMSLVVGFGSSDKLAGAYGLSTNGTMTATTIGFFFVMWRVWKVNLVASFLLCAAFLTIDVAFLGANLAKLGDGGWVPLSVGSAVFALAMTWRWGRRTIAQARRANDAGRCVPVARRRHRGASRARDGGVPHLRERRAAADPDPPLRARRRAARAGRAADHPDARHPVRGAQAAARRDRARRRLLPRRRAFRVRRDSERAGGARGVRDPRNGRRLRSHHVRPRARRAPAPPRARPPEHPAPDLRVLVAQSGVDAQLLQHARRARDRDRHAARAVGANAGSTSRQEPR